jgi:CHASE2 domain-containing sensor protein
MMLIASSTAPDIVRVVWSSILATVGLIRAGELRRTNHGSAAAALTAAAVVALLICVAAVVYGVILVGQKN